MNFLVCTPTRGTLFTRTHTAVMREFVANSQYPMWITTENLGLIAARNVLVERALKTQGWDYVLLLDDDIVLPEGAFKAFETTLSKYDVAIMDYPYHWHPQLSEMKPTGVTFYVQYLPGEDVSLKEVAWSGLGATALSRESLQKLWDYRSPLFRNTANPVQTDALGRTFLETTPDRGLSGQPKNYSGGEDTQFFFDAKALGLTLKLVPKLTATHLRLDHAVSWISEDKYNSTHSVEETSEITQPGNMLHVKVD